MQEQNYPSTQTVLDAATAVIANNEDRKPKRLWTDEGAGEPIVAFEAADEQDEAAFVAEQMRDLESDGMALSDVAVFYRTNAQSRVIEEVLVRYGLPYQVVGGPRYYDRREVKDAVAYLRAVVNPDAQVAIKRLINVPRRAIGNPRVPHGDRCPAATDVRFREAWCQGGGDRERGREAPGPRGREAAGRIRVGEVSGAGRADMMVRRRCWSASQGM